MIKRYLDAALSLASDFVAVAALTRDSEKLQQISERKQTFLASFVACN